jgi:hypothetical protein
MTKNQQTTKSPIKEKPLRHAGQSLDAKIDDLIADKILPYSMYALLVVMLAGYEWWRFYKNNPPSPKTMTVFAGIVVIYVAVKIKKAIKEIKSLRLGRDGERIVGEYLDALREDGHRIFHDLLGDNFNLDHVIVSTKGIFVIETKTYSKPVKGDDKIRYDGEQITIAGRKPMKDALVEVTAAANWLRKILKESTGKDYSIKPVVVFPGWFVETKEDAWKYALWVMNPKALKTFINKEKDKISHDDMMLATFHLAQYIRSKVAK